MEQHVFDDCIGNPPFEEALKILGDVGGGGELTEGQAKFFDMKRKLVDTLQEGATENEKKLAGIAKLFINYSENMQKKLNGIKRKLEKIESSVQEQNGTKAKSNDEKFKMWNCLVYGGYPADVPTTHETYIADIPDDILPAEVRGQLAGNNLDTQMSISIVKEGHK